MNLGCTGWVLAGYFVHFLVMYLQCSSLGHHLLPPVTASTDDVEDVDGDIAVSQSTDMASQVSEDLHNSGARSTSSRQAQVTVTDLVLLQASRLKCSASSSPSPFPPPKRSWLSSHGPAVVQDIANAIHEFSASMSNNAAIADTPSTPKRRQAAIEVVEQDGTFTTPEQIKVWNLFYKDIAAADTYIAISDKRKRNWFIWGLLDIPADESHNPFL